MNPAGRREIVSRRAPINSVTGGVKMAVWPESVPASGRKHLYLHFLKKVNSWEWIVIRLLALCCWEFCYLFISFISTKNSHELEAQRKRAQDSIAFVQAKQAADVRARDTAKTVVARIDTLKGFEKAAQGTEQLTTIENEVIRVVFSNKGGQPVSVTLKQFKSYDSSQVRLIDSGTDNHLMYSISTGQNKTANVSDLFFDAPQVARNADGSQTISYSLPTPAGESLVHQFTVRPNDYLVDWNIEIGNPGALFYQNSFNLSWRTQLDKTQRSVSYERRLGSIGYYEDNQFDYMVAKTEQTLTNPVQWVAVSQQFFNTTLIAKKGFSSGAIHLAKETADSSNVVERAQVDLQAKIPALASAVLPMQLYYGPNDFTILDKQAPGMTRIIDLGRGVYSFVRPINVYVIMPVFNFFQVAYSELWSRYPVADTVHPADHVAAGV